MKAAPITSILATTDLTAESGGTIRAAAALAEVTGADLHVLHAFDFDYALYSEESPVTPTFAGRITDAETAVDEQIARAAPSAKVASRTVVIQSAHQAILDRAIDVSADLIVMGAHRGKGIGDAILGGTADRVIRTARVPCLVMRGELSLPLKNIVVPLDLSDPAREALSLASALPSAENAVITVIHVLPTFADTDEFPLDQSRLAERLHREAGATLEHNGTGVPVKEEIVRADKPADGILDFADAQDADLIVLATHGRGALERALIGSVASGVARRSTRPILLVPPSLWGASADHR